MTPNMIRALSDAEACEPYRGLERTVAGWHSTHPHASSIEYHSFSTVTALLNRGYVKPWDKGRVVHITDAGRAALERTREKIRTS